MLDFDFGLGEWIVRPQRCCIERGDEVIHLAPKAMAVLTRLAASAGEVVTRQELFDSVWPRVEVSDDALTQRVAELRRAFGDTPQDPRYIETIPKVGFRLIGSVADIPEDSSAKGEIADQPATPASTRLGIIVIAGLFLLAIVLFTLYPGVTEEDAADVTAQEESPSIAVLPFANLSTDEGTDYLCTGMADTILNMLAQNPNLHVTSGTSSFQPCLDGLTAPEIAELLGVTTVLEGSVQRQGTKLRITAQLIDAINDAHLWSRNFDLDDADIFAIEDEIAAAVTSAMHIVVREDVKQRIDHEGMDNAEAYDEYMKARSLVDAGKWDQVAVQHVDRAIELDPEYALAYVLRGQLYGAIGTWPELHVNEKIIRGREAAKKATELAPDMPAALVLLAGYTDDRAIKGQLLRRAYENGPNDVGAILAYAQYLVWDPNPAESEALAHKALELDPLQGQTYWNLAILRMGERRVDKALEIIDRWKEKIPESTEARWMEGLAYFLRGQYSSQVAALLEAVELEPENYVMRVHMGAAYLLSGMPEVAQAWFESTAQLEPENGWFNRGAQMVLNAYNQRNADEIFAESRQLLLDGIILHAEFGGAALNYFVEHGSSLGRLDEVLATFEQLFPHLFAEPPYDLGKQRSALYATALALLRYGDAERGEPLMIKYLELQDKEDRVYPVFPWSINGRLALGEREAALEKFREFADAKRWWAGNTTQWMFRYSSLYDPIRNEPEFIALLELYGENAAEQRRLLEEADFPIPAQ